jgi:AraC-like DNA-binding protein
MVKMEISSKKHTVAAHYMRLLFDYLNRKNYSIELFLQEINLDKSHFDQPSNRIDFQIFNQACHLLQTRFKHANLGITLGQLVTTGHLGPHGFALMTCSNAKEILQQNIRFSALTIDAGSNILEHKGNQYIRYWKSNLADGQKLGKLQDELHQASYVTLSRHLFNRSDLSPLWVSFQHSQPEDISEYEALFQCPLYFEAEHTAIGFHQDFLNLTVPSSNASIYAVMNDLRQQLLKQLGNQLEPSWLAIARKTIIESFQLGGVTLEEVARSIGFNSEELKTELNRHDMNFRSLVDDIRQNLAISYVRNPGLSLVEIAFLLGFSEQSAFQRAFKRWTGKTPKEYRTYE